MKILKKIPLFPFLLVLFFCLHGTLENYGYINFREVLMVGLEILGCVTVFFLIVLFFAKDRVFAALVTFFITTWYLFYGAILDQVKGLRFLSFMQSHTALILILLTASVLWIIFLKKKRSWHPRLNLYFNILVLVYCSMDTCLVINKYFSADNKPAAFVNFEYNKVKAKPNVYLLLFDEYAGYRSLKDSFAFSNDSLYDFFKKNDFRILPAFSNYDYTLFSMSSILNMRYVDNDYDPKHVNQRDLQLRTNEIRNATIVDVFKKMGYRFNNYSIFDIDDQHGVSDHNAFIPVHSRLLTDKILHNRFIRNSGWLLKKFPLWKRNYLYEHDVNNKYSEQMVINSAARKTTVPEFCYAHFIMPHSPFYRDSLGGYNPEEMVDDEHTWPAERYLAYLKYTNTFIRRMMGAIISNDPGAMVIVMSDHGYRSYKNTGPYEPFNYNNICAVRFPGSTNLPLRDTLSMVNFFPYFFNCGFGQNIPYLPDSIIVLQQ